jgi:hypothetical protein
MTLSDVRILVVGEDCWGKGRTIEEAMQNCLRNAHRPKKYRVFVVHDNTTVDSAGRLNFPMPHCPIEISRKGYRYPLPTMTEEK